MTEEITPDKVAEGQPITQDPLIVQPAESLDETPPEFRPEVNPELSKPRLKNPLIFDVQKKLWALAQNWFCAVVGPTGSGKSYTAMSLAKSIDPHFTADRVYFDVESLLHDINNNVLKKGSAAVLDESGVVFSSRKWQSEENRHLSNLIQVIRHRRFALIFTLPNLAFMDITGRKLLHAIIETQGVDRKRQQTIVKWKVCKWSDYYQKTIMIYPIAKRADGKIVKVTKVRFPKPPEDIIEAYEKKKMNFTRRIAEEAEAVMRSKRESTAPKVPKETKRMIIEQCLKDGLSISEIVRRHKFNRRYIQEVRDLAAVIETPQMSTISNNKT